MDEKEWNHCLNDDKNQMDLSPFVCKVALYLMRGKGMAEKRPLEHSGYGKNRYPGY